MFLFASSYSLILHVASLQGMWSAHILKIWVAVVAYLEVAQNFCPSPAA